MFKFVKNLISKIIPSKSKSKISNLVAGLESSLKTDAWKLYHGKHNYLLNTHVYEIANSEAAVIISFYKRDLDDEVTIFTDSFDEKRSEFNKDEMSLLWDIINKKFPNNDISEEIVNEAKAKEKIVLKRKKFEDLGAKK